MLVDAAVEVVHLPGSSHTFHPPARSC
jgi:hypothetical protein